MRFKLMLRGRGYIGAAGIGQQVDAADSASTELDKRIFYIVPKSGLLSTLFSGGKQNVKSGFISTSNYDSFKAQGVLMDSKSQLENIRPPSYALYRMKGGGSSQ